MSWQQPLIPPGVTHISLVYWNKHSHCLASQCIKPCSLCIAQNIVPRLISGAQFPMSLTLFPLHWGCSSCSIYSSPHMLDMPIFLCLVFMVAPNLIACHLPQVGKAIVLLNCTLSTRSHCAGGVPGTVPNARQQNWFYCITAAPAPVYIYFILQSGSCHSTANTGLFSLGTITRGKAFPMKLC